ncbi:CaiB/BaiF CoA-transferase family protein [Oceanicoccus sp. KOV_DT_Chl]|uniref:CaiB/BaiF CoA transferase family protein n=1 Tax=Oceanicoccus sp. KOV_DT_Chl TaxID=1904639 RepID=UPI000C797BD9|nr:CaiB/BaiF CoA-transferase family protein [Oceanicoccus sp. KOV_DT_Chl]
MSSGPLAGVRVVEMAGIGPGPFACMLLSDMGAEVIRVDRASGGNVMGASPADVMNRGRKSVAVDLKKPEGVAAVLKLIETADILIEGFRPGVMEKLGLGPEVCHARNDKLVYGRMTGWGQDGPLSQAAGHDINYIAITGALDTIGREDGGPIPPLNLLGDFGGGSMYLVMGVLAAYIHIKNGGKGQVIDTAITDGTISLMSFIHGFHSMGMWDYQRQNNMTDGGAHYYDTYETADGLYISIGSIEPQFYRLLIELTGIDLDPGDFMAQFDKTTWKANKSKVAAMFKTKTRAEWDALLEGTDVCYGPVLTVPEATQHPHNVARKNFVEVGGVLQSAPAPRFSGTPAAIQGAPVAVGNDTTAILAALGLDVEALVAAGAVAQAE